MKNVTLASEDDNDNSDVIVLKKLEKFSIGEDLQDALQCNVSRRMAAQHGNTVHLYNAACHNY